MSTCTRIFVTGFMLVVVTGMISTPVLAVVPVPGAPPILTPVTINSSPGDQFDPHVSGDWAAYTDDIAIRYYNFITTTDAQIPLGLATRDLLSDVSGSKIVFSRVIVGVGTKVMVFDATTPLTAPLEIDPAPSSTRLGAAIGGNTVAYIDFDLQGNGELMIHDLATASSVRITNDTAFDENPSVSPDGNVVTWEHCASLSNCDIWQAVKSGGVWTVSVVAASPSPEMNPDTNGSLVVYDSDRGAGADVFWRPVAGGAEVQLQLASYDGNPSIAGDFIAFESRATAFDAADLFVYDIVNNRLYQITSTLLVIEQLNDITLLPDGRLRVVWSSDEDGIDQRNIKAATFRLPGGGPCAPDLTPPSIDVTLNRTVLWPPNHKLVNIHATVSIHDACDPDPTCQLVSITSNEPDEGGGEHDERADIRGATFGTCDVDFQLRAERNECGERDRELNRGLGLAEGGGGSSHEQGRRRRCPPRLYTIIYCAGDHAGNVACDTVVVRVPHDRSGHADAVAGLNPGASAIASGAIDLVLMVRGEPLFDAGQIDPSNAYLGNELGALAPSRVEAADLDGDGLPDLELTYSTLELQQLMELTGGVEPIGLHYTLDGEDYLVADIFASVAPITPLAPGGGGRLTDTFNSTPAATAAAAIERTELDAHNVLSLASPGRVRLEVYAITGQRVKLAVDGEFGIGRHPLSWDGRDEAGRRMPSGVYFYRVSAPGLHRVKKVSMLR